MKNWGLKPKEIQVKDNEKSKEQVVLKCDINSNGEFEDIFLVVSKKCIIVKRGEKEVNNISVKDIEELKIKKYINYSSLVMKKDEDEIVLCCFTNKYSKDLYKLVEIFKNIKEGKEVDFEELKKESEEFCPKCGKVYEDQVLKICDKCLEKGGIFKRLIKYSLNFKKQLLITFVLLIVSSLLGLLHPYMSGKILFDEVLRADGKYYGKILDVVLVIFFINLISFLINLVSNIISTKISTNIIYNVKTDIFKAMQRLSIKFYTNRETGILINRVNDDAEEIQDFMMGYLPNCIMSLITLIGGIVIMLKINVLLTIIMLIPTPFAVLYGRSMLEKTYTSYRKLFKKRGQLTSFVNDSIFGMKVIKVFGKKEEEIKRFKNINKEYVQSTYKVYFLEAVVYPVLNTINNLSGIVIYMIGGFFVYNNRMTLGELIAVNSYYQLIVNPISTLTKFFSVYAKAMNSAYRMFEVIDSKEEILEKQNPIKLGNVKGNIELKNVDFSYEPNRKIIKNMNLSIGSGEFFGIVGHTGAGKSTLANLILRLYDVDEGEILIDGHDVKDLSLGELHKNIAIVSQETFLFSGSILDNVRYGRPEATVEEVISACKMANAHEFIMKMSAAYETNIGSGGVQLSGGERQRISIARAILCNPKILILDEATASLDTKTERAIQESLQKLIEGRTTIAIAHRLSTLREANRIGVIEDGELKECGTHEEVIKLKGIYYSMLQKQSEAMKLKGV